MANTTFKDFIIAFQNQADETQKRNLIETHRMLLEFYVNNYFFEKKDESSNLLKFFNNNNVYLNETAIELGYGDNDDFTTRLCDEHKRQENPMSDLDLLLAPIDSI